MSKKESGWEDLLKCAPLRRKQLWHLCWSAANKHAISRSILSLQTPHIFHCVEQYFLNDVFCLLCVRNAQCAPNMVCVCHNTCCRIASFIVPSAVFFFFFFFPSRVWLIYLMWHIFLKGGFSTDATLTHTRTTCAKWQYSTTGHLYPECLPSCGLTSFSPSVLCSLFYQPPLSSRNSVCCYGIDCALLHVNKI